MNFRIGTAGWVIPKQHATLFSEDGGAEKQGHLQRYSSRLRCTEINSSFYRPHRYTTWQRWAATTPADFRFSVKAPKAVTHVAKLVNTGAALLEFFTAVCGLGDKLGPVLVQLPPRLEFDESTAREFFTTVRELHKGSLVLEPRHASWFSGSADRLLQGFAVSRAAADPPKGSELAATPGGWTNPSYWRLHGSPRTYYSEYDQTYLETLAKRLRSLKSRGPGETWVVFDNTALGHASANAVWLRDALK